MTTHHLPLLHQLDSDPEVMRYLLGRARTPEEIDAFWAPRCADTGADDLELGWWVGSAGGHEERRPGSFIARVPWMGGLRVDGGAA